MGHPVKPWPVCLLVWLLSLSFPIGAASAAFVHMHADITHETDHHDGRQVHRHGPAESDHEHEPAPESSTSETGGAVACGPVAAVRNPDDHIDSAPHPLRDDVSAALSAPTSDGAHDRPHESASPPDCPDDRAAALRGPPRA